MIKCQECGYLEEDEDLFVCERCGAELPNQVVPMNKYPKVPDAIIDYDFAGDVHPKMSTTQDLLEILNKQTVALQQDHDKSFVEFFNRVEPHLPEQRKPKSAIYETEPKPKTKAGKDMITRCLD